MSQDDYIRTALRVPRALHSDLHRAADESERSFNAEIIERLKSSFDTAPSVDGAVSQELADSRGQTIRAMVIIQKSLCEAVQRMYGSLDQRDRRDRNFEDAVGLATGLLEGTRPAEYLLPRAEMKYVNPSIAQVLEDVVTRNDAESKRVRVASVRPRRTNAAKR